MDHPLTLPAIRLAQLRAQESQREALSHKGRGGRKKAANKRSMVKSLKFIYVSAANGEGS